MTTVRHPIRGDGRIPVYFDGEAVAGETTLREGQGADSARTTHFQVAAPHLTGCACCRGRSPTAMGLDRLYREMVTRKSDGLRAVRVVATQAGRDHVRRILTDDVLAKARFRPM